MPAFSAIINKRRARRLAEAGDADAGQARLGPPPVPPPGPLATESYAQSAAAVARSEYARRRARPVNALTARPALGSQQQIRRATKPGAY